MPFSLSNSTPSSRPSSRASSPTRNSRVPRPSNISTTRPRTPASTAESNDLRGDYFGGSHHSSSGAATPVYGSYTSSGLNSSGLPTASSDMWTPAVSTGAMTPGGGYFPVQPVEIVLDSDQLVMRGQGGDMNPAYLSGRIDLNLSEATNIKEISMSLHGKAKVQFSELTGTGNKNHHFSHPCLTHDWSFLQGDKKHTHTLKAGYHSFPFSLMLDGNLPSSLHTYTGDAQIQYKLKATVVRAGFASNFHDVRTFTLNKTFTPEALEFNQTLEIENTWPGKVMYSLTLPFKAYAAGDDIPVNVKFMPLAKGVRVTTVTSVIKEYTLVHTRHSSHSDQRVAASVKHEMRGGRAILTQEEPIRPPSHWTQPVGQNGFTSRAGSRASSPTRAHAALPIVESGASSEAGPSTGLTGEEGVDDIRVGDDEVDTMFTIPIPAWTTPSHSIHPVFVTHKIKWSCSISNADGHVSELRCALPIVILDNSLLAEARAAGSSARGLLCGGSAAEEAQQVDLPSYSNHVYDRVAVADSGNASGLISRSYGSSGVHSPHSITPPVSRGPSRPASPNHDETSSRSELSSWTDPELLASLDVLRVHQSPEPDFTPPASRGPSRPLSRRNSRSGRTSGRNSRVGSRANSPDRSGANTPSGLEEYTLSNRLNNERRSTGGTLSSLLHLPASFKPMRPLTGPSKPILRNSSAAGLPHLANDSIQRNSVSFTNLTDRRESAGGRVAFANGNGNSIGNNRGSRFRLNGNDDEDEEDERRERERETTDPISRVPSYAIASRGFLGGGVVPLDVGPPTYDDSERNRGEGNGNGNGLIRPRSDTALVNLGSAEAAAAETRAGDEQLQEVV